MVVREVRLDEKDRFNQLVTHPLQSWQWGDFREKTGLNVLRIGYFEERELKNAFLVTFHPIPKTNYAIGYLPKCNLPDKLLINALRKAGEDYNCIFFKLEPDVGKVWEENQKISSHKEIENFLLENGCVFGRPLFTKYTFQIDLKLSEEELLSKMKPKTRYNIKLAQKHGVTVVEDNSDETFKKHLDLMFETTRRQRFYAHNREYHQLMWQTLQPTGMLHLLKASLNGEILVTWVLFVFNNVLYYPYGASSSKHREKMASNLMMWEAIRFGKKIGCQTFDLWGCLGPAPNPADPWFGFHRFKAGYNPYLIKFVGSFDLVINPFPYKIYQFAENLRWKWLKLKTLLPF